MTTNTLDNRAPSGRWSNKLEALFTQENIITIVVSIIVGVAVILPLITLVISSFLVLDDLGFDTEWGFGNYVTIVTDPVIPKAFVNTLIICSGCTVLATLLGVSLAWTNARTNCPGRALSLIHI